MSEIQRYKVQNGPGSLYQPDVNGLYVRYTDLLWYKRHWALWAIYGIVISLAFGFVCSLLVYEKSSHGPVAVPMGAGEKASLLMGMQAMQADKERAERRRDDLIKLTSKYKAQIKALNAKEDGHVAQLAALQARGHEIDREQAQRMSTHQGLVMEAKRVLGVEHVQIVDR